MCSGSLWSGVGARAQPEAGVRVSLPFPALSSVRCQLAQKGKGEVPAQAPVVLRPPPGAGCAPSGLPRSASSGCWKLPLRSQVGEGNPTCTSLGDLAEPVCMASWDKGRRLSLVMSLVSRAVSYPVSEGRH